MLYVHRRVTLLGSVFDVERRRSIPRFFDLRKEVGSVMEEMGCKVLRWAATNFIGIGLFWELRVGRITLGLGNWVKYELGKIKGFGLRKIKRKAQT